jgi:hypothetical protein
VQETPCRSFPIAILIATLAANPAVGAGEREIGAPPADRATTPRSASTSVSRGLLFHPDGPGQYRLRLGVGASMAVLPLKVVQSETRQLPQLAVNLRFGLPYDFSVDLRANAILITNQVELGVIWATRPSSVRLMIFDHHGINYGFVGVQGFDASSWEWINKPGLGVGFHRDPVHFTLTLELIYTLGQHARLGDLSRVSNYNAGFTGTAFGITVENVLRSQAIVYYGISLLRTAPNYELWLAFSDQRARLLYPRFFAGYVF